MDHTKVINQPLVTPLSGDVVEVATAAGARVATLESIARIGGMPVGNSVAFTKTSSGTNTLLAAASNPRFVTIIITTTEAIADAGGTKPAFTIGEEDGSATKFIAAAAIGTTLGAVTVVSGTLSANKKLEVYATAAVSTGTGGITPVVIAVKASS